MLPTRTLTRDEMDELNTLGLLHLCHMIHMHCHQPDWLQPSDLIKAISWITYKLNKWYNIKSSQYDNTIKLLCEITLKDLEIWLEDNKKYYRLED